MWLQQTNRHLAIHQHTLVTLIKELVVQTHTMQIKLTVLESLGIHGPS
jgi:hypothetical protein